MGAKLLSFLVQKWPLSKEGIKDTVLTLCPRNNGSLEPKEVDLLAHYSVSRCLKQAAFLYEASF